jgi:hypothetical protein
MSDTQFYTIKDIAKRLYMTEGTVRNRLCKGDAMPPHFRAGRRVLFPADQFAEWTERLTSNSVKNQNG